MLAQTAEIVEEKVFERNDKFSEKTSIIII